jgi:hypothetical protein
MDAGRHMRTGGFLATQVDHRRTEIHAGDRGRRDLPRRFQRHVRRSGADVQEPAIGVEPGRSDRLAPPDSIPPEAEQPIEKIVPRGDGREHALDRRPPLCRSSKILM